MSGEQYLRNSLGAERRIRRGLLPPFRVEEPLFPKQIPVRDSGFFRFQVPGPFDTAIAARGLIVCGELPFRCRYFDSSKPQIVDERIALNVLICPEIAGGRKIRSWVATFTPAVTQIVLYRIYPRSRDVSIFL